MRVLHCFALAALALPACSDFRSIYPIADPAEKLEEPGIIGDWVVVQAPEPPQDPVAGNEVDSELASALSDQFYRVRAIPKRPGEYRLTSLDSTGHVSRMLVRPTRIDGRLVLDFCPDTTDLDIDVLPVHTPLFVLRLGPDTIVIAAMADPESRLGGGDWGPGLAHIWLPSMGFWGPDSTAVVTASTAEIRRFLAEVQALPGTLSPDVATLRRVR